MADNKGLGRFIVIEGLDGSGSSTQAALLSERLIQAGKRTWLTSEPSAGPIGQMIRLFFSGRVVLPPAREVRDRQFAYLFAADRFDHLNNPTNGVFKHLAEGIDVISTRYMFSSVAYNAETNDEKAFVQQLNAEFPMPDGLIFLDCPVELAVQRLAVARPTLDTYENRGKLRSVETNYREIIGSYTGPKLAVDASLPRTVVAEKVFLFASHTQPFLAESNQKSIERQPR
jgi:dTMP kinase